MKKTCATALGLCLVLAFLGATTPARACSTFRYVGPQQTVFGKNYDWYFADGHLMVNKRSVERRSKISDLTWTSTHGSVTFNQFGRNSPSGGINEVGVVVELMWHDAARYPEEDARPAIGNLEWIQYQLDTADTIDDIVASDAKIRILPSDEPLHYLVADAQGGVASIEFLDGRMVVHRDDAMPVAALTNDDYSLCLDFWQHQGTSASKTSAASKTSSETPSERSEAGLSEAGLSEAGLSEAAVTDPHLSGHGSQQRFARAGHWLQPETPPQNTVAYAFEVLADLAQGPSTQWSIVYEIERRQLHFKIRQQPAVFSLALQDLDFSCAEAVQTVDLLKAQPGDLAPQLNDYSVAVNRSILDASFAQIPSRKDAPETEMVWRAQHPSGDRCLISASP